MRTAIVIPARYASQRLPGKPLLKETGKYLVQHVYERACQVKDVQDVLVATDDPRIAAAVRSFGGRVHMTRRSHRTGTDRAAEVATNLPVDTIINLQGDEPLVEPSALETLTALLERDGTAAMATLAVPCRDAETWRSPHCVKVVVDNRGRALYFSRSPIPYVRDGEPAFGGQQSLFLRHVGLYAYRKDFLLQLATTPTHPLEEAEKLEQLRVLAMGQSIAVGVVQRTGMGVDTYADYRQFVQYYRERHARRAA